MDKKVIIAGGGTGGHIFPAVAIANALKKQAPATSILFIGAAGKMEMEKVPQAGFEIRGIDIAGFNRSSVLKNISLPFKLLKSFTQVSEIFKGYKPDAVIGVGGYSSFPVLRYAQAKNIPSFIHESNSFAGKANILLGKKATRVFVAASGMDKFFPAHKLMVTGNPIRRNIALGSISRSEALKFFGLDPARKTILVTGGSLGAKNINEAIADSISEFSKADLQLIWQTGKLFFETAKQVTEGRRNIWAGDFISQMEYAFAASDIVISRAGAMAVSELCVAGKPVILVPYPFAAEDHQTENAMSLVNKGAGLIIRDVDAKEHLFAALESLATDQYKQDSLKENIKKLAVLNADEVIAAEILKTLHD